MDFTGILFGGGEGIVIKDPQGDLFKRKPVQDDDGQVLGYTPGKGKYQGMTGALVLKLRSGRQLKLSAGLNDNIRKSPPAIGSIVQFAYSGKTVTGLPRFARFLSMRIETSLGF